MKDNMETNLSKSIDNVINHKNKSMNPIFAVFLAILFALLISTVNLILFIRSDMYEKVRIIQNPEQIIINNEVIDISSPLTVEEITEIRSDIDNLFTTLKDDVDYPENDISELSIGF